MKVIRMMTVLLAMLWAVGTAGAWQQVNENAGEPAREFRAAWVATVFNLDWPSRSGLSAAAQQRELIAILDTAQRLRLNAIILQVRPNGDALYRSSLEPWSGWLSGPGVNPGYDPLAFAVQEAHRRGLELHAWFNPFRATISGRPVGRGHISQRNPRLLLKAGSTTILNPSASASKEHVLKVIMDVVRRYDIDGVHLDDYFYPYPPNNNVADGKSPAQRRAAIDSFVSDLYSRVKREKPWVRVGISPFGIWQPGYPAGVSAGVNAYEHLACDARKWLAKGWVDYLSPQLYWRIQGPQSFTALMQWWAGINRSRPVWPGIASVRINSSEDPGRPASEIGAQVDAARKYANRTGAGEIFWSWKSLGTNRGGVQKELARRYSGIALPPPMPWSGSARPARPGVTAQAARDGVTLRWNPADNLARKWVVQVLSGNRWHTVYVLPGSARGVTLPTAVSGSARRIAVRAVSGTGVTGQAGVCAP